MSEGAQLKSGIRKERYGDIYPVTSIGRVVTMISSVFGIAIIALPSGVITAGYLSEIDKKDD